MSNKYYSVSSFAAYYGRYKLRLAIVFLSFLISNLFLAFIPVFIGKLIGTLAAAPIDRQQALFYVFALIICSTGHDVVWRISEFLYMKFLYPIIFAYENIMFQEVIRKPYPYFVNKFTGKIGSYIGTIGEGFRELTNAIYWDYMSTGVSLITVAIILSAVKWETGLSFIAGLLLMLIVGRYTIRNSIKYERLATDVESSKKGIVIDTVGNFVNVKSFRKESAESLLIQSEQKKVLAAHSRAFKWGIVFWGSMSFFVRQLIWPITIGFNMYLFLEGEITLAQFSTFISAILLFSNFIWQVIWNISQYNLKISRIEEAYQYLFGKTNIVKNYYDNKETAAKTNILHSTLKLSNISFAYPDQKETAVLKGLNITLNKGQRVGVVGKSGSGKTTLTKLLLGYYPLNAGNITLDGLPIETKDLASLISYVPQDISLFHRTIAENIAYASDKPVSSAEIKKAAKQAHADEFISKIRDGYNAMVGERGVKLSTGQRQRLAIARAILDDRPILILDEATSALDSESEVMVQKGLEALWQNKTVIAIAHRLSTLRHMDKIIVMDNGKIAEQGTHEELLKANGSYAKLWAHQSGGFIDG